MRQCSGCRRRRPKADLIRLATMAGQVVVDREGRLPGRGAYLCLDPACAARLARQGGLARRLRVPPPATTALEQRLRVEAWPPVWDN